MKDFKKNKLFIVCGIVIIIWMCIFAINLFLTNNKKDPIFCIKIDNINDGGSCEFYGILYKINKYVKTNDTDNSNIKYSFGSYFMKFNNPFSKVELTNISSSDLKNINSQKKIITTNLDLKNETNPDILVLNSKNDIEEYLKNYNHKDIINELNNYDNKFFENNSIIIANVLEKNNYTNVTIDNVVKHEGYNQIDIVINKDIPDIKANDDIMFHLIVSIDKKELENINNFEIVDSNVKYL